MRKTIDYVSNVIYEHGDIEGANVTSNDDKGKSHSITNLIYQIMNLAADNYKVENSKITPTNK